MLPLPVWLQVVIAAFVLVAAIAQELHETSQRKGQS
jgi:hypothetical protein